MFTATTKRFTPTPVPTPGLKKTLFVKHHQTEQQLGDLNGTVQEDSVVIPEFLLKHDTHSVLVGGTPPSLEDFPRESSDVLLHAALGLLVIPQQNSLLLWHSKKVFSISVIENIEFLSLIHSDDDVTKTTGQGHILPLSGPASSFLPLSVWVPTWDATTTGLLSITGNGNLRFWESLALGSNQFVDASLNLSEGEIPCLLRDCGMTSVFILTTNKGMYKISLSNSTGSSSISCVALQKNSGMLSLLLQFQQSQMGTQDRSDVFDILPVRSLDRHMLQVNVLSSTILERWALSSASDKFLYQISIGDLVHKSIERDLPDPAAFVETLIEDAVAGDGDRLILLVRFSLDPSTLYYMIITVQFDQQQPCILDKKQLSYQQIIEHLNPQDIQRARLGYVEQGDILFAFFPNAVVLTSSLPDSDFEQIIQLQNQENILFAFDTYYQKGRDSGEKSVAVFYTSNPTAPLLQIEALSSVIHNISHPEQRHIRATESIRLNLEQAIFFGATGSHSGFVNPLSFDLTEVSGDLEHVCLQVSESILRSESRHIHPTLDLRIQMSERLGRLNQIISYINENQVLDLLSEESRWLLCQNVEKMVVGLSVWQYQNSVLSEPERLENQPHLQVLSSGIASFMKRFGATDNAIRLFFKHHLDSLPDLIQCVLAPISRNLSLKFSQTLALETHEASKVITMIYQQALHYRTENAHRYGLGQACPIEPWLGSNILLDLLQAHVEVLEATLSQFPAVSEEHMTSKMSFDANTSFVDSPAHLLSALLEDLCNMVDCTLGAYQQRINFLDSLDSQEAALESQSLKQKCAALQPRFIYPLVKYFRKTDAFRLAEKYHNFQVLVNLTLDDPNRELRIEDFIKTYHDTFSHVLFATYLDRGMYHDLLDQPPSNQESLDAFLLKANTPWLAWIQDVHRGRYHSSYNNLMGVVDSEPLLEKKKLALDLAKLSILTSVNGVMEMINTEYLEQMGNMQEFVNLQIVLRKTCLKECHTFNISNEESYPIMDVVKQLMDLHFKELAKTTSVCKLIVTSHLKKLVQGQMLSPTELIDLLSVWDKSDEADEILTAVGVLGLTHPPIQDPEYIRNRLWRRVFLKSDWARLHQMLKKVSDEEWKQYLRDTSMYRCLESALRQTMDNNVLQRLIVSPSQLSLPDNLASLGREYPSLAGDQLLKLLQEFEDEQEEVTRARNQFQLDLFFSESVNDIQSSVS